VVVPNKVVLVEVVAGDVLVLVVVELVELAAVRVLAGLVACAGHRLLVLTRTAATINNLGAVFINEFFLFRLIAFGRTSNRNPLRASQCLSGRWVAFMVTDLDECERLL
jgi:hypothetical protein